MDSFDYLQVEDIMAILGIDDNILIEIYTEGED